MALIAPNSKQEEWRFAPISKLNTLYQDSHPYAQPNIDLNFPALTKVETTIKNELTSVRANDFFAIRAAENTQVYLKTNFTKDITDELPVISFSGVAEKEQTSLYHQIKVEEGVKASLCLEYVTGGNLLENIQVEVADSASLNIYILQDNLPNSVLLSAQKVTLGKDAKLNFFTITTGGAFVRNIPLIEYQANGGEALLNGLYFADENQYMEDRILIEHSQPNCKSNLLYKGALQNNAATHSATNEAKTTWIGDVSILPAATGTDTYEINRNLLLTKGTRADSVPNLEIYTGDIISAGHASATAKFSEDQLFYLQSRGITEEESRRLLLRGFFKEVINKIPFADLAEKITAKIEKELALTNNK